PLTPPPPTSTLFPYTTLFRSFGYSGECGRHPSRLLPGTLRGAQLLCAVFPGPGRSIRQLNLLSHQRWAVHDAMGLGQGGSVPGIDRKSTRLNSSHVSISYAVF